MSGYTKGPLQVTPVDHLDAAAWAVVDKEGDYLALGCLLGDATLYAAAPDMYDALKLAREVIGANAARDAIDAALAKANGND